MKTGQGRRRAAPRAGAMALAVALALAGADAQAFGIGWPQVGSALGQTLHMQVPLSLDPDVEITPQCIRLLDAPSSDGLPMLGPATVVLEGTGERPMLRIDSLEPVEEPAFHVTVEVGCAQQVRREFTVLLDPQKTDANASNTASAAPADDVADLNLGPASIEGQLGQVLHVRVPVTGGGAAALRSGCVRLVGQARGDGAPVLSAAQLELVRSAEGTQILVTSLAPVDEPALRLVLEAGCETPLQREYSVLLAQPPAPQAAGEEVAGTIAAGPAATPTHHRRPHRSAPKPAPSADEAVSATPPPAVAAPAAPMPPTSQQEPTATAASAGAKAADRLLVATAEDPATASAAAARAAEAAVREAELLKRVEALSGEVRQLRADLAVQRARKPAEPAPWQEFSGVSWPILLLGLAGLGGAGWFAWRRRSARREAGWPEVVDEFVAPRRPLAAGEEAGGARAGARARQPAVEEMPEPVVGSHPAQTIEVSELVDTVQAIDRLYTSFVDQQPGPVAAATSPVGRGPDTRPSLDRFTGPLTDLPTTPPASIRVERPVDTGQWAALGASRTVPDMGETLMPSVLGDLTPVSAAGVDSTMARTEMEVDLNLETAPPPVAAVKTGRRTLAGPAVKSEPPRQPPEEESLSVQSLDFDLDLTLEHEEGEHH